MSPTTLPSGKEVNRVLDEQGRVIIEVHGYGEDITLTRYTRAGEPVREVYRSHGLHVDRDTYEMVRVSYPDMPAADPGARDHYGERLRQAGTSEKVREYHATLPHHPTQPGQRLTRREDETLPSGKRIRRAFTGGRLVQEAHSRGDITIQIELVDGTRAETYLCRGRLVSRKTYERERRRYPDLPPADASVEDVGGELLREVRAERQRFARAANRHVANREAGRRRDAFCIERMKTGRCADAREWVQASGHTLGELTPAASRRLVDKLTKLGAVTVHACEIDSDEDGAENSGHLVVELPAAPAARAALVKEANRLARAQGYEGDFDDGQRYVYLKLD